LPKGPGGVIFLARMPAEPITKRTVAFFDGQNLFHAMRDAFGYTYPNYAPRALAECVCRQQGWQLDEVRFYTGVPDRRDNPFWNRFWSKKLLAISRQGAFVFSRPLRYHHKQVRLPDGTVYRVHVGQEKGVDVRIAIDVMRLAHRQQYDVALVFSQDQDLSEAAAEIREIAHEQGRWIKIASAFPSGARNRRGIDLTDWISIDRVTYDSCIDSRDYR
jgi:uncharacterized LabA/DUF88 family protein